jgi:SAM-dependent methyltransferase
VPWYYAVAERDHEIQNPTSAEKIRLLGERLRLGPRSHVLDLAAGKGGPAAILAEAFGCRVTGVERSAEFFEAGCARLRERGLDRLVELVHADAVEFPLEHGRYDVAMCLGASFVWGGLAGTLDALAVASRRGGFVVVGEPYWKGTPPEDSEGYVSLAETVRRFDERGLPVVTVISASEDDWDRYETLHWLAVEEWLAANPDDADAAGIRARHVEEKEAYLASGRERLGWAILAGRKG